MVNIVKNNNSSQAIKDLEYLALQNFKLAHPTVPYSSKQKYSGNNTNGLTTIIEFLNYSGCQAERINSMGCRIGQLNNVMCTYFLGQKTIDEYLYEMIQAKRHVGNAITGATDKMEMTMVSNLMELFN